MSDGQLELALRCQELVHGRVEQLRCMDSEGWSGECPTLHLWSILLKDSEGSIVRGVLRTVRPVCVTEGRHMWPLATLIALLSFYSVSNVNCHFSNYIYNIIYNVLYITIFYITDLPSVAACIYIRISSIVSS